MSQEKYIAIGDIHGCARSLDALLEKTRPYADRTHVFIGDYIDRGPDSRGVIDRVRDFAQDHHCIFLRGNHEAMLLDAVRTGDRTLWLINGGTETLESYRAESTEELPDDLLQFISETKFWHNTPQYLFIHAGLDSDQPVEEQLSSPRIEHAALWERGHVHRPVVWEKTVVFGHTPVREPLIEDRKIAIDTGCVFTGNGFGKLTALLLPERTTIQQEYAD
ncbi:MAG: metallophosphoesterase family protein [Cyclonatronaceae bacterium]